MKPIFSITLLFFLSTFYPLSGYGQADTTTWHITLRQEMVNKTGREVMGMTINGSIPGPVLRFTEGDYAVIYLENQMDEETSIHWHGLLLPNFFDGVPYLTIPAIMPGETLRYEYPLRQSGTYWYNSHTMLQEEIGVYGAFVIEPEIETLEYYKDLILVISDWTNEKPMNVLRNLKRDKTFIAVAETYDFIVTIPEDGQIEFSATVQDGSGTTSAFLGRGEITRIIMNNLTMMHHPMHLHGHFFRVINEHGEYSPLKHTVNVPPMEEITIEFYGRKRLIS